MGSRCAAACQIHVQTCRQERHSDTWSCYEHLVGRWTAARTMTTSLWRPHRQHDIVSVMFLKACMGNWGRLLAYATSPKVWNPELEGLELKGLHLQALFDGLDSRTECSFFAKRQSYDSDAHLRSAGPQRWSSVRQPLDKRSHCCLLPAKQQAVQLISWAEEPTNAYCNGIKSAAKLHPRGSRSSRFQPRRG